jgi:hypothetical protein
VSLTVGTNLRLLGLQGSDVCLCSPPRAPGRQKYRAIRCGASDLLWFFGPLSASVLDFSTASRLQAWLFLRLPCAITFSSK